MRVLSWIAVIVPTARRPEWLAEWQAEFFHLQRAGRLPKTAFLLGALPHALWERKEEWSMENLWMDVRFALRSLTRHRGFALITVLTVALGVGVNTSIFTLVNGVLLRPPSGISEPDELVQVGRGRDQFDNFSYPAFALLTAESRTASIAAWEDRTVVLGTGSAAAMVPAHLVSGNYFEVLGVRAARGRVLTPADDRVADATPAAVLSDAFWRSHFGGDPAVVGSTVEINRRPFAVVGVLPPDFSGVYSVTEPPALFLLIRSVGVLTGRQPSPLLTSDMTSWLWLFGRPQDGASAEQIEAEMQSLAPSLQQQVRLGRTLNIRVAEGLGLRPDERQEAGAISAILLVVVGLVLLATCANLAGLFIARTTQRVDEVSVRMALGAGRLRLFRQLITESTLLSLSGALLAVPLTYWAAGVLPSLLPYSLAVGLEPDSRVLGLTVAVGLAAGVLFGLAPALRATRFDLIGGLRQTTRTGSAGRSRARAVLVVVQLAVAMALLSGTGLLVRSVTLAQSRGPGFDTSQLILVSANLRYGRGYSADEGLQFFRRRLEELEGQPGIVSAAVASSRPISQFQSNGSVNRVTDPLDTIFTPDMFVVSPGYFETLGLRLLQGRLPERAQQESLEAAAVVNEALANRLWPGQSPLGRSLTVALHPDKPYRVAAVVADVKHRSLQSPPHPTVYLPLSRGYRERMIFHVRARGDADAVTRQVQAVLEAADPQLPLGQPATVASLASATLAQPRLIGWLTALVALLALTLGAVGLGGLIASAVARRRREMGIRMALGASQASILRLVVGWGATVTAAGLMLGLAAALGVGQLLQGLLFGIGAADPTSLLTGAAVLLIVALAAAFVPARQALQANPIETLRTE